MLGLLNIGLLALIPSIVATGTSLPQVDLGYEIHQAGSFNESGQTYSFSNIRYAQPPVGNLRFAAPVPPTGRTTTVNNGSVGYTCPQANPGWLYIAQQFTTAVAAGNASSFNYSLAYQQYQQLIKAAAGLATTLDPTASEDCLFLDVIVPKAVFDGAHSRIRARGGGGAPVIVWIYGGGYTGGSKAGSGNPSGLIKASQADGSPGIIYVAMNYRLGAMGWLSGPTLQEAGGVANAGLYDQRLAIEWVSKNIHLFGGDPNQITLMGESAGGGSIEHQITAYGGLKPVKFQRAIPQSPGFLPTAGQFVQENTTQTFLKYLNVSSIAEARKASSDAVRRANSLMVFNSNYGSFSFGPVVDGTFVPALPGILFNAGGYAKNVSIMAGHNSNEAPLFTPPYVKSDSDLASWLSVTYPGIQPPVIQMFLAMYPAIYDGSQGYKSPIERTFLILTETIFICNTHYMHKAYGNKTYAYEFEVFPAFHGQDVQYTYYNGQGTNITAGLIAPVAQVLQGYITNFAKTGNPNGKGLPWFPIQGNNATEMGLNATSIMIQKDPTANYRCDILQKALFT